MIESQWEVLKRLGAVREYVVRPGDSLSRLAKEANLRSWRDLYDHPCNAPLRKKRKDPSCIWPGDRVCIPVSN